MNIYYFNEIRITKLQFASHHFFTKIVEYKKV